MKRTLEAVPGLHAPGNREHNLVDQYLIDEIRMSNRKSHNLCGVIGCILGALLVCDFVGAKTSVVGEIVLLVIVLFCFSLCCSAKRREINLRKLVQEMEQRRYQVVEAWAMGIHSIVGDEADATYGLAKVCLDNGTFLNREYRLPFSYAAEMVRRGTTDYQRVLLVYLPSIRLYRLVPAEL